MTKKTFNFPSDKNLNLINYLDKLFGSLLRVGGALAISQSLIKSKFHSLTLNF